MATLPYWNNGEVISSDKLNSMVASIIAGDPLAVKVSNATKNDLNQIFETEFQRPLSNDEFTKLNQWLKIYDKKKIIMSLRKASMYQKLNFAYIEKILENS